MTCIVTVARMAGYSVGQSGGWQWISPCPACRATTRHTKTSDPRGPVAVSDSGRAKCLQCGRGFTAETFCGGKLEFPGREWGEGPRLAVKYPPQETLDAFASIHRDQILVPLYDHEARHRSWIVRFREPRPNSPKSMSPKGFARRGLAMANDAMRSVLHGYSPCIVAGHIVIAEGETDFLAVCESTPFPCVGIISGSWTADWSSSMPVKADIMIATDLDKAGDQYAEEIRKSLAVRLRYGTVRVRRWDPPSEFREAGGNDLRDYFAWEREHA